MGNVINAELVDLAVSTKECPECKYVPSSNVGRHEARMIEHLRKNHNIISGRMGNWRARGTTQARNHTPMVQGEPIVLGPVPTTPTTIRVRNGAAQREITVYIVPMGDIVDAISSGIRQLLTKRGLV